MAAWDEMEAALEESEQKRKKLEEVHQDVETLFDEGLIKYNEQGCYEAVRDEAKQRASRQE